MKILKQLKTTNCVSQRATGIWTKHYTMTLWKSMEDVKNFSKSGAHLEAMKLSAQLAKEIRILSYESSSLPDWKEAKKKLYTEGKLYKF